MNILKIGTIDKSGGAALISWKIKLMLEELGNKVSMFVASKYSNDPSVFIIKRTVHRYFCFLFSNDIDFFKTDWIMKTEQFKNADIVHCHNLHGWFFNLNTLRKISERKPLIWTLHDMWAITPHCAHSFEGELKHGFYQCPKMSLYPRILWHNEKYLMWRKRFIYQNTKMDIVVPSLWLKNKVEKSILKDKKIHLIYNGIDIEIFKQYDKLRSRRELNVPLDKKIILFVSDGKNIQSKGNMWKYIEVLLKKYRNRKDIHFISIGNEDYLKNPEDSNVVYISKIKKPEILAKYYSSADIFLYPSLADSFGLVVAEAMACGIPILTFNTGGIPEIVEHKKNGYIANYKDCNDLISGFEYLLHLSKNEKDEMISKSIEKIKSNFTDKIMIKNYMKLYKSILLNNNQKNENINNNPVL